MPIPGLLTESLRSTLRFSLFFLNNDAGVKGFSRLIESTGEAEFHNRALPPWCLTELFLHTSSEISTFFSVALKNARNFNEIGAATENDAAFFAYV